MAQNFCRGLGYEHGLEYEVAELHLGVTGEEVAACIHAPCQRKRAVPPTGLGSGSGMDKGFKECETLAFDCPNLALSEDRDGFDQPLRLET